ncbi:hypothetical protein [Bradyrhizobium sp.]|uniref:hypothetical protein n=1 Tax=Bradyrhizobium sp. TaxID=376 RepID=UPI00352223CE
MAALAPGSDVGPDGFLGQADQALYAAKHMGRNRVIFANTMLADFSKLHGRKKGEQNPSRRAKR